MLVRLEPQGRHVSMQGRRQVATLLRTLGVRAGTVLVIRGEDLLTEDEFVEDDDEIELRAVVSGGAR